MSDISKHLDGWSNIAHSGIRKILGEDGRPKIQIRIDQGAFRGILQMELEGRPDGLKPEGYDYYLDFYKSELKAFVEKNRKQQSYFLSDDDCKKLFDESFRLYSRYTLLLEIEDFRRVVRDTEKNMDIFRFVKKYAADESNQTKLERWWPYLIRINAIGRVKLAMGEKDHARALQIIDETKKKISLLKDISFLEFETEKTRSILILEKMENEIINDKPITDEEKLKTDLKKAVKTEDFERAAELRDILKSLGLNPEIKI